MTMTFRRVYPICLLLFLFFPHRSAAQVFINDAGARDKHFIYEVKQIDEFFERFNNDTSSFIRKVYSTYQVKYSVERSKLIRSLFNSETQLWDNALVDSFVSTATDTRKPEWLDFYAGDWFAEARCEFRYNSSVIIIPVILRIETDEDKTARWVIAAIKASPLNIDAKISPIVGKRSKNRFINPASHANNFIDLGRALNDKAHLTDYFDNQYFSRSHSIGFYNAIMNDQIKFITVKEVKYHFLQIDPYIFTVEYFSRKALNSGWLINSMKEVSETGKDQYKKDLLEEY